MSDERRVATGVGSAAARALSDRELVLAMRRDDARAFGEFMARFHPLLLQHARRARVFGGEHEALVFELLADSAMRLASSGAPVPRSLAAYLITALRHRLVNGARDLARRDAHRAGAMAELDARVERAVLTVCSESSIRASRGLANAGEDDVRPALRQLALALERELDDDDRALAGWLGAYVPHRQIAAWLGISHDAAHKRVRRLRARLRATALRHIAAQPPAARRELEHFLRRAGVPAARAAPPAVPEENDHG